MKPFFTSFVLQGGPDGRAVGFVHIVFFINCVYDRGQRWLTYTQWIRKKLSCDRQAGKTSQKTTAGGRELGTRGGQSLAVVIDYVENGFQYQFESAMVCPFYLCPGLQTFKQAEIRYGKVPPGRGNDVNII